MDVEHIFAKVDLTLGRFRLEKVKEIRRTEDMAKNGVGECKAIITFKDKIPSGFVLGASRQECLHIANVSFLRYKDMGWLVKSMDDWIPYLRTNTQQRSLREGGWHRAAMEARPRRLP